MKYPNRWDLDSLYAGGVSGQAFIDKMAAVKEEGQKLASLIETMTLSEDKAADLTSLIKRMEAYEMQLSELFTFSTMCSDVDVKDNAPVSAQMKIQQEAEPYFMANLTFDRKLASLDVESFEKLLKSDAYLQGLRFNLNERRKRAERLLSKETEELLTQLERDGIQGWSHIYDTTNSKMEIAVTLDGEEKTYSVGQVLNRFSADKDPEVRATFFKAWEEAFAAEGPIFQDIMNHLAGYRLTVQKAHGYQHFLEEPLEISRMERATLDAMWQAVSEGKEDFVAFLRAKQKFLGLKQLGWQDFDAPLVFPDLEPKIYTWDEACDFVIDHYREMSPAMGEFALNFIKNGWVEAEDRTGKRPGAYSSGYLANGETRIFMTFTGSATDVSTLAHELGHAYHSEVMRQGKVGWQRDYAMNVAETASTFAETLVANASLKAATSKKERLQLLAFKMENPIAMFMDIHARFLFESAYYTEREEGFVSESRLNELMIEAQKEAFAGALDSYHPHFWCSKLHFFMSGVPFYNFPYTFGFLFSLGIYETLTKDMSTFEEKYRALLEDTGSMKVEELAKRHLGVDLTKPDFWKLGVEAAAKDARLFVQEIEALEK